MRYSRLLSLINGLMMSGNVVAAIIPTMPVFNLNVDLTLTTYWDTQYSTPCQHEQYD